MRRFQFSLAQVLFLSTLGAWLYSYFGAMEQAAMNPCRASAVMISPDAKWVARRCSCGVSVYDANTGDRIYVARVEALNRPHWRMSFSRDSRRFAFITREATRFVDLDSQAELAPVIHRDRLPYFVGWGRGAEVLVLRSYEGTEIWRFPERRLAACSLDRLPNAGSLSLSPDGRTFAIAEYDMKGRQGRLTVREVQDGTLLWSVAAPGRFKALQYSPDNERLLGVLEVPTAWAYGKPPRASKFIVSPFRM